MSDRRSRLERRQAEWRAAVANLEAAGHDPREARRLLRARVGWRHDRIPPAIKADPRQQEDRRQAERREESLSGEALDRRLAELGISADRRVGQRRRGGDRRR